jgi:hypothetical protein
MIKVFHKDLDAVITLKQAAKEIPGRPSLVTMHRWVNEGKRGVILDTISTHQGRCTTRRALNEFFQAAERRLRLRNPRRGSTAAETEQYIQADQQLAADNW